MGRREEVYALFGLDADDPDVKRLEVEATVARTAADAQREAVIAEYRKIGHEMGFEVDTDPLPIHS